MKDYRRWFSTAARSMIARFLIALCVVLGLALPVVGQDTVLAAAQDPPPAAPVRPTPEPTPDWPVYTVQAGDTLYAIAERFGSTVEAIVAANDIADPRLIGVGQRLYIPTAEPERVPVQELREDSRLHTLRAGEILPSLALHYGTTVWALYAANDLAPDQVLWPGERLRIPAPVTDTLRVPTFPELTTGSTGMIQGQTILLEVEAAEDVQLSASFLGQQLHFMPGDDGYWALAGVDALTSPGAYGLTLSITETQSGDLLAMYDTLTVTAGSFGTYNVVVPADRQGLLAPSVAEAERQLVNAVLSGFSEEQLWDGIFGLPLAGDLRTTAPFGQRRSYNGGPVSSYHSGQDLGADTGTPVYAPMTGTVVLAEPLKVRGQVVILDHGLGVFTGFWHLSQIDVTEGQRVGKGEVVGLVGNTGLSTGPHLHWEMRVAGVPVDPFQWTRQEFP
ncbi:MAG: LysM peptidoglycan-binding domain-containing M23 family metallopeptidase [Anaerolineae bacterium]